MQRHIFLGAPPHTARLHHVHAAPSGYISLLETSVRPVSFFDLPTSFFNKIKPCQ
ncbi:MAG: hypothetical protein ISQ45_01545 [Flavobacteriaceae bacterium]|nr:hypothetical protein [Flavobacteriaceae bacterium]